VGPDNGSLKIKTGKEGAAAKAGHDLVLGVNSWSGSIDVENGSVELTADPGSVEVESGSGGAKPLSDKDKADIKKAMTEKVLTGPISFKSLEGSADGNRLSVRGELDLGAGSNTINAGLTLGDDGKVTGSIPVTQTDFGITPFKAMMGAMKVKDQVEIVVDVQLPTD
jgi:hypothetical protein